MQKFILTAAFLATLFSLLTDQGFADQDSNNTIESNSKIEQLQEEQTVKKAPIASFSYSILLKY